MRLLRWYLAFAWLLAGVPAALAADPAPAQQVERVPPDEALAILGTKVAGPDGKAIGRLVDVLVNASGTPQAAVIDFGGFMGVGARKIAVHWSVLHFAPADPKTPITLDLTPDQIKAAPEYRNPSHPAPVVVPAEAANSSRPPADGNPPGQAADGSPAREQPAPGVGQGTPAEGATEAPEPNRTTPGNADAASAPGRTGDAGTSAAMPASGDSAAASPTTPSRSN